jgi:hypothetical protein
LRIIPKEALRSRKREETTNETNRKPIEKW